MCMANFRYARRSLLRFFAFACVRIGHTVCNLEGKNLVASDKTV